VIFNNGSDGAVVEMLTFGLDEAAKRGYHALTFDGPGQGQALYEQGLFFRYDWEHVITPVVDWAAARDDVDANAVALFGCSQAGYWVPRAAALERRLAAAIADPGVVKVNTSWIAHLPEPLMELYRAGDREQFDGAMAEGVKNDTGSTRPSRRAERPAHRAPRAREHLRVARELEPVARRRGQGVELEGHVGRLGVGR
jgi:hypothetical protein